MMGVSEIAKSYEIIIVARVIVGICAGQICSTMSYDVRIILARKMKFTLLS